MITEHFAKLKVAEVDIKKDNHVLMVNNTTSFKKAKGAKGSFKKGSGKRVSPTEKKLKSGCRGNLEIVAMGRLIGGARRW
jgi:hypothetical protein